MSLLAIRKCKFEGVYSYSTKEEYSAMIDVVRGNSCRRFEDAEADAALSWAGVSTIQSYMVLTQMNQEKQPVSDIQPQKSLTSLLAAAVNIKKLSETVVSTETRSDIDDESTDDKYVCTGCGTEYIQAVKFCANCGSPVKKIVPIRQSPDSWICTSGHINPLQNAFCAECGEKRAESEESKGIPNDGSWICSSGHTNRPDSMFCVACGERKNITEEPVNEVIQTEWVCSSGHTNDIQNLFCMECGEHRPETASIPQESEHPNEWICSSGHTCSIDSAFCPICGEKSPMHQIEDDNVVNSAHSEPEPEPVQSYSDTEEDVSLQDVPEESAPVIREEPYYVEEVEGTAPIAEETVFTEPSALEPEPIEQKKTANPQYDTSAIAAGISRKSAFSTYDYERISNTAERSGHINEILRNNNMLNVPMVCLFTPYQNFFLTLQNIFYAKKDALADCYIVANDDPNYKLPDRENLTNALNAGDIKWLNKCFVVPQSKVLLTSQLYTQEEFTSDSVFDKNNSISYIINSNVIMVQNAYPPESIGEYDLITDSETIAELIQILT